MDDPKGQPFSRRHPLQPVCRECRRGYGSRFDGLCSTCRGQTAWEAQRNAAPVGVWMNKSKQ